MWSPKSLGRMALATMWSVGGMGPGKTKERVTALREERQGSGLSESVGRKGWMCETLRKDRWIQSPLGVGNEGVEKPDRSLQHVWPREEDRGDIC